jgi:HK97 family phage prohead protease
MDRKYLSVETKLQTKGDDAGQVSAVFSTFGVVDYDGDIVERSAFTDGEEVPMVWAHRWYEPIGKGVIRVLDDHARFDGTFFMDTEAGLERYKTVKAMGSLQEWSWGFRVVGAEYEQRDGETIRHITDTERFEVSPVLKGAGIGTHTEAIKSVFKGAISYDSAHSGGTPKADEDAEWDGPAAVASAEGEEQLRRMHAWVDSDEDADTKGAYKLPHHRADGTLVWNGVAAAAAALEGARGGVDIPSSDVGGVKAHLAKHYSEFDEEAPWEKGRTYTEQSEAALAAVSDWFDRTEALAALRAEDERTLSQDHIERLERAREELRKVDEALEALLWKQRNADVDVERLFLEYQKTQAMLQGVALD